jgi:hypothetical protein
MVMLAFCTFAYASQEEKEITLLFEKYDSLMAGEKLSVDSIFTGELKEEFDATGLTEKRSKSKFKLLITAGSKDPSLRFVKRIEEGSSEQTPAPIFILRKIKDQWRIEGTMHDDH